MAYNFGNLLKSVQQNSLDAIANNTVPEQIDPNNPSLQLMNGFNWGRTQLPQFTPTPPVSNWNWGTAQQTTPVEQAPQIEQQPVLPWISQAVQQATQDIEAPGESEDKEEGEPKRKEQASDAKKAEWQSQTPWFEQVLERAMGNPDTQRIMQDPLGALNPLGIFMPQQANASEGDSENKPNLTVNPGVTLQAPFDVTDPNAIAMPSGEQIADLSPEDRDAWEASTAEGLALTAAIASLPFTKGTGAGLGKFETLLKANLVADPLLALMVNANNKADIAQKAREKETQQLNTASEAGIPVSELVYGVAPSALAQMYEDEIYDLAMANDEQLRNKYGNQFGSYLDYSFLGDTTNYDDRRDVTRDIFGLNEGDNPYEIKGLKDIYFENGTINNDMTNEEMLDAILNRHFGAEYLIDPNLWLNNAEYQASHQLGGSVDYGTAFLNRLLDNGYFPVTAGTNIFEGIKNLDSLDNDDFVALLNAGDIINRANSGKQFDDKDLQDISNWLGSLGDRASFAFLPEGANENNGYYGHEWNSRGRKYDSQSVKNAIFAAGTNPNRGVYDNLEAFTPYGIDVDMADAIMEAIEKNDKQGRKIGRNDQGNRK